MKFLKVRKEHFDRLLPFVLAFLLYRLFYLLFSLFFYTFLLDLRSFGLPFDTFYYLSFDTYSEFSITLSDLSNYLEGIEDY